MTNREFYTAVINTENATAEVKAFAEEAIAKMDARNKARTSKPTKNQEANEVIKTNIVAYLTENGQKSAGEIAEALELSSTSKASSLLRQLVEAEVVDTVEVRVKGKGKHKEYFIPTTD